MDNENTHTVYVKNLNTKTFNSTFNLRINSNANIKTVLNTSCYFFDERVETASGKAVVSGKIGIKVLYIDTDNLASTLTEVQPFSENLLDNAITNECIVTLSNLTTNCKYENVNNTHKIDCVISFAPVLHFNMAWNNLDIDNSYITKQSELSSLVINSYINTSFNYVTTSETRDEISKILFVDSNLSQTNYTAQNGYVTIEGKINTLIVYETTENEQSKIKELCDSFNFKTDVEIENLTESDVLDLFLSLDKNKQDISTELDEANSVVTISHQIKVYGVSFKTSNLTLVDDLYSVNNELNLTKSSREFVCNCKPVYVTENIMGEISLNKDDPAIEEIICNCNVSTEITNTYLKNNTMFFEGIVNSTLIYLDETKELKSKDLQVPFVINTKFECETLPTNFINLSVVTTSKRARRGTIIELEYCMFAQIYVFDSCNKEIVDSVSVGKAIDNSKYDYQIYVAKPNETIWDICKRIKCHPDSLNVCNKNLPNVFTGNEKVIVKR